MKKMILAVMSLICISLSSCVKDNLLTTYTIRTGQYINSADVPAQIGVLPAKPISSSGKISLYGNYVFIAETLKGVHIVDISNTSSPRNLSFLNIPGCMDIALRNGYLYANSGRDLVIFNVNNPSAAVFEKFIRNTIDFIPAWSYGNESYDTSKTLVGIIEKDTLVDETYRKMMDLTFTNAAAPLTSGTGRNGSMARMVAAGDYLYYVSAHKLQSLSLAVPAAPVTTSKVFTNNTSETIYPFGNSLFVGGMNGMNIYSLTDPGRPALTGSITHWRMCDPVVTDGRYAYVTLHSDFQTGMCPASNVNQLQVIDVHNLASPVFVNRYEMERPLGLGLENNNLLIADGPKLKMMNVTDPMNLTHVSALNNITPVDVIMNNGIAIVTASSGLYIVDYSNPRNMVVKSRMTLKK